MSLSPIDIAAMVAGFFVWALVAARAVRVRADLVVLALVLVVLGLLGSPILGLIGFGAPGSWSFLAVGIALMFLWPRHEAER